MIDRYSRVEMKQIWSEPSKYLEWLRVEKVVCEFLAKDRVIPAKDWKRLSLALMRLQAQGGVDPKRVEFFENQTRHDVIAFTTALAEKIGKESRWIHFGLTSSDVVDTAFSIQVQKASVIIRTDILSLIKVLELRAREFRNLPTIGRSHGIFAEPTSFGLKFLGWSQEWKRNLARFDRATESMRVGKLSGAVGVNAHWSPNFEQKILKSLGLKRETVSTQVLPRDHHADWMSVLAICGSSLERIAIELRHLQRSEVAEVREGFSKGQKGSSAMPHKRNPISSENISGLARVLRGYAISSLENIALWHERDISHSSVERICFPDASILLDYALVRMTGVIQNLEVDRAKVAANRAMAGTGSFSGHVLLALVKKGVLREDAYKWVQECALEALDRGVEFFEVSRQHSKIVKFLTENELKKLLSDQYQLRHVGQIFQKTKKAGG